MPSAIYMNEWVEWQAAEWVRICLCCWSIMVSCRNGDYSVSVSIPWNPCIHPYMKTHTQTCTHRCRSGTLVCHAGHAHVHTDSHTLYLTGVAPVPCRHRASHTYIHAYTHTYVRTYTHRCRSSTLSTSRCKRTIYSAATGASSSSIWTLPSFR